MTEENNAPNRDAERDRSNRCAEFLLRASGVPEEDLRAKRDILEARAAANWRTLDIENL